jgi:hypothetical protein
MTTFKVRDRGQKGEIGDGQLVTGCVRCLLEKLVQVVERLLQRVGLDRVSGRSVEQDRLLQIHRKILKILK